MPRLMIIAVLAASFVCSACNTTAGAGKDMQSAGKAIENTANDAKTELAKVGFSERLMC